MKLFSHVPRIGKEGIFYLTVSTLISTLLGLVLPFAILIIFDRIVPNSAKSSLVLLFFIILISIVLDYFVKQWETAYVSKISKRFEEHISNSIFKAICQANIARYRAFESGDYLERINSIAQIRDYFSGEWIKAFINGVTCIVVLALVSLIDIGSGITLVAASVVLWLIAHRLATQKSQALAKKSDLEGNTNSKIVEIVSHPINLKSSAMEYRMENLMNDMVEQREFYNSEYEKIESSFALYLSLVQQLSIPIVVVHCALSVIAMDISQGVMAAVILLTNRYFAPYQQIMGAVSKWKINQVYLNRLNEILELEEDIPSEPEPISIERIDISDKIEVSMSRGNVYVLKGPSCSGKSYLTRCLSKEIIAENLNIDINGLNIDQYHYGLWRYNIVRVDSQSCFVEGSIINNITCFRPELYKAAYSLCEAMAIKGRIDQLRMGFYTEIAGNRNLPFSRQVQFSLAIIRALLCQKQILIVDDIDLVYDDVFARNLISCISPRVDALLCIFISNKLQADSHNFVSINIQGPS